MKNIILDELNNHIKIANDIKDLIPMIEKASLMCIEAVKNGNKILLAGNGGSAADAQHIAAEFTGRFKKERIPLGAIALTTDTSALTAIGNDYGFDKIFQRQVLALARSGDIIIGISTSGNSQNIINCYESAKDLNCKIISLTGRDGGKMRGIGDLDIIIPSDDTPRIQEMHIFVGHTICHLVDLNY